jgi:hypothetical protein
MFEPAPLSPKGELSLDLTLPQTDNTSRKTLKCSIKKCSLKKVNFDLSSPFRDRGKIRIKSLVSAK